MPYTINKTNGGAIATIQDGYLNNTTDLTLIGKNYSGYGEILNENFVKLLENFANSSAPGSPLDGQLWWDLATKTLKVWGGSSWKIISGSTASSTAPTYKSVGDLWFDTTTSQLKVWNGTDWTLIGPSYSAGVGTSGAVVDSITDNSNGSHVVVRFIIGGDTTVAILSKDSAFVPQTTINGFATIYPGMTISSTILNAGLYGKASDSDKLDALDSTSFMRTDANTSTTGILRVLNDTGLSVGASNDLALAVSGNDTYISNATSNGQMYIRINKAGTPTNALHIDANGYVYALSTPLAGDNSTRLATTAYVDAVSTSTAYLKADGTTRLTGNLLPDLTSNNRSLGSTGARYFDVWATNFNGTATQAEYADLAERFESDAIYEPGTVVELGGDKEITAVAEDLSDKVFGVISTRPGFLLNGKAGGNDTHPAVALNGRVPVKVVGKVNRGDRLVSAGNGLARAAQIGEATTFNVIGRSLESTNNEGVSTITAIVKVQ